MNETNAALAGVDWKLLRRQKTTLVKTIQELVSKKQTREAERLRGILHLLDALQDEAARTLGEGAVFGRSKP